MFRWWNTWVALMARREVGDTIAVFRIAVGLALLATIGSALSVLEVIWIDRAYGGYRTLASLPWQIERLGGATPAVVGTLAATVIIAALLLVAGFFSRSAAFVGGQAFYALSMLNEHTKGSYDALLSNALWILVFAQSDRTLSLACRLRTGRFSSDEAVPAWPRALAVLQLAIVYHFTALHKVSAAWTAGDGYSAIYYILQQPAWQRWDMSGLAAVYPVTQIATALVWWFEATFPIVGVGLLAGALGRLGRRGRKVVGLVRLSYLSFGVLMHIGIHIVMDVGTFSMIVLAFYPCLLAPAELRRALGSLVTTVRPRGDTQKARASAIT